HRGHTMRPGSHMSAHSAAHHAASIAASSPGSARARAVGSELLRFAAVTVLAGNFVLGTYQRHPVHTALIGGYLAVTLLSLAVTIHKPYARWRQPLFALADAVAILHILYMHASPGPLDHGQSLTPPGLVVIVVLLMNAALTSDPELVAWFSGIVFAGWVAIIAAAVALSGLGVFDALSDADVQRELGLALSFGVTAL